MWLFTQYGFYSVVCARDLAGSPVRIDHDTLGASSRPSASGSGWGELG